MAQNMDKVRVNLKKTVDHSYDIHIGPDLFGKLAEDLKAHPVGDRYVLIADATVLKLHGNRLTETMRAAKLKVERIAFPAGEGSKSRKMKVYLEEHLFGLGLGRDCCFIACGGGVTGDLVGYTAATFMRGVPWIQVPTTMLAMVDASIGGKTGIDLPEGKNLIGAFHQPAAVWIDVSTLETLPRRHLVAGMAEVVKHAVIRDRAFFKLLEDKAEAVLDGDPIAQRDVICRSCAIKAEVVSEDEKESELRRILNYGHTLGHAFEAVSGFSLLHGEAVSLGMASEGALAVSEGILPKEELDRQNALLKKLGLPVKASIVLRALLGRAIRPKEILDYTHTDKKARQGITEYVMPAKIGQIKTNKKKMSIALEDRTILDFLRRTSL